MNQTIRFRLNFLIFVLLVIAFVVCYYYTILWLHYKYSGRDSYYSHGYLIPIVCAYLIYLKKDKLRETKLSFNFFGLAFIFFALVAHIFASMADINFISGFTMLAYILGCSLYFFGTDITKVILFPILFLFFMFPIPSQLIDLLGLPTKSLASTTGLAIIKMLGIPYFREGFRIDLASGTFIVGTPCNGMRSLISFAALGFMGVHFFGASLKTRITILVMIYPLSVLVNGLRIAILVYIAHRFGIENAVPDSPLHDLSGLAVFFVGLMVLFLLLRYTDRVKKPGSETQ